MGDRVELSKRAMKELRRVPRFIAVKLKAWVDSVETVGLLETRKVPGYHDEPLKGERRGQRSIRLSRSYRAIYTETRQLKISIVTVAEVHKHDY